jgi:hypothetical protein
MPNSSAAYLFQHPGHHQGEDAGLPRRHGPAEVHLPQPLRLDGYCPTERLPTRGGPEPEIQDTSAAPTPIQSVRRTIAIVASTGVGLADGLHCVPLRPTRPIP